MTVLKSKQYRHITKVGCLGGAVSYRGYHHPGYKKTVISYKLEAHCINSYNASQY